MLFLELLLGACQPGIARKFFASFFYEPHSLRIAAFFAGITVPAIRAESASMN
ncbi:hypothetical protein G3N95_35605 [Paraburkholderia sp. Tr-20389]|uniref:hypothetical protein n=1 Tax=Paraburkholderia sp. Tr-20389 TaxID=2703903 RepID=UPI00197FF0A6|nr:hypothetical protein [Paraburkholderia sp. Tr-20389]MBN3758285.1 hypothetical protein [Paraburkholderia sp. Tr-20389]